MKNLNKTKPPKNRDFLGYVDHNTPYWGIFFWGKREDGLIKSEYVDRGLFQMPKLIGWTDLPEVEGI